MTFRICYNKTGKEISVSNSRACAMLNFKELDALGWKSSDMG